MVHSKGLSFSSMGTSGFTSGGFLLPTPTNGPPAPPIPTESGGKPAGRSGSIFRVVGVGDASPNSGEFRGVWQTPKEESRGLHGGGGLFWHGETVKHEWTSLGTLIFVGVFFSQAFTILSKSST